MSIATTEYFSVSQPAFRIFLSAAAGLAAESAPGPASSRDVSNTDHVIVMTWSVGE